MKISLMWMTRKRSHELVYSLSSFINNADDNENIEYFIAMDSDDPETAEALPKISVMCYSRGAILMSYTAPKRYGYAELEQYQNAVGKAFTGECLFILNDDLVCIDRDWDFKMRNALDPFKKTPKWIGIAPLNERWKGSLTFVGINRTWYDVIGRVSGTRATDGYLQLVGERTSITPIKPDIKLLHLQRGKKIMDYTENNINKVIYGLPDDGAGGYSSKNKVPPKYVFEEGVGKQRLEEDIDKLKIWIEKNK